MKYNKSEKGQALIIITFAIIGLIGLTGLAVDGSLAYAAQRKSQNTADSAAYAAALATIRGKTADEAKQAAQSIATANGGSNVVVEVNPLPGKDCKGNPVTFAHNNEYTQVIIKSTTKTTFGSLVGIKKIDNCAEAITRATPYIAGGGGAFGGAGVVTTAMTGKSSMMLQGGTHDELIVTGTGAGVWVNSNDTEALSGNSALIIDSTGTVAVVGGYKLQGQGSITPDPATPGVITHPTQVAMPLAAWNLIPIQTTPTCSFDGSGGGASGTPPALTLNTGVNATLNEGNWGSIIFNGNNNVTLNPGTYCFKGNFNINGTGVKFSMPSGQVKFVLSNDINLGSSIATANDLEVYTVDKSLVIDGSLTATRFRFYSTGTGKITINSKATLSSGNAHIRLAKADPVWNGDSNLNLTGPPSGDPLAGLTIYGPWDTNTSDVKLNGGSAINITGTILMPHCNLTVNGGAALTAINSQVVSYTLKYNGGADFKVNYNPNVNFGSTPPVQPTIQLVK